MNTILPKLLEEEHYAIREEFDKIRDSWPEYDDEKIPEDKKLAKRIINFIIGAIDDALENFEQINIDDYKDFLGNYYVDFFYGPVEDAKNYLDFSKVSITELCADLNEEGFELTKAKMIDLKKNYIQALKGIT